MELFQNMISKPFCFSKSDFEVKCPFYFDNLLLRKKKLNFFSLVVKVTQSLFTFGTRKNST
jgi:hypothetical protein